MTSMADHSLILLVEDTENDILITQRAFTKASLLNPLQIVRSGEEAIEYLKGEGRYANRNEFPLPDLVLLDLKMPGISGFDVLRWIRKQPTLGLLRVIVLTTSDDIRDVNLAYQLGANSFIIKPVDFEHFVQTSKALKGYWLWMSEAPESTRPPTSQIGFDATKPNRSSPEK
jgi:CheY-like chemotaxis protein